MAVVQSDKKDIEKDTHILVGGVKFQHTVFSLDCLWLMSDDHFHHSSQLEMVCAIEVEQIVILMRLLQFPLISHYCKAH